MQLTDFLAVGAGLVGLFFGGDWLVKGAARLATAFGIPSLIIGLTVVAVGTSTPELLVSISAALAGTSNLALGNVIGSNIANIGLILGVTSIIFPVTIDWRLLRQEIPFVIAFSLAVILFALDGSIDRLEGGILLIAFGVFSFLLYRAGQADRAEIAPELTQYQEIEGLTDRTHPGREALRVIGGLALLMIGAQLLVNGATGIARALGVSELIIGLSLVAVGTSLPELVTCSIAAFRKENDIVMGNIIGSNIANLLIILGVTSTIQPIPVAAALLEFEFIVMIVFALVLIPLALRQRINRVAGAALLMAYGAFIAAAFTRGTV